jgi:prolyl oligopeptidase
MTDWKYPAVNRIDKTFEYKSKAKGEVTVPDPYYWLETPPSQSAETKAFCDAQAALTQQFVDKCADLKEVRQMLDNVVNYPRYSTPRSEGRDTGKAYYYALNSGLDPQSTWYVATEEELAQAEKDDYATPAGKKFFDENLMSKDGTTTVGNFYFSRSGKTAAYTVSHSGSDWYTVYFRNASETFTEDPKDADVAAAGGPNRLPDVLKNVKFSGVQWDNEDKGVLYQRYTASRDKDQGTLTDVARDAELYYHRLGTKQEDDILVMPKDPSVPSILWAGYTTRDGKWLLVTSFQGTEQKARVHLAPLTQGITPDLRWISVAPKFEYHLNYLANDGNDFYFMTNKDAPNWKIVRARVDPETARSVQHPTELTETIDLEDVIPEDKDATLDDAAVVNGNKLLLWYIKDVKHQLYQHELTTGKRVERLLPDLIGSISSFSGRKQDDEAFLSVTSFITPGLVYRLKWNDHGKDARALPTIHTHRTTKVKGLDLSAYETRQIFVTSQDGAKVPVYLTYLKGTPVDGTAPAWLYFYGGFAHSLMPTYSPRLLSWIGSYGGVLVWVNARGGSEYGEAWHNAGNFLNKKNTFNDVIAAARHVVDEKIVAKGKIIVNGGSNGGLGAMAVGLRAPEGLLGAIVAEVGVLDMLRFNQFTAGTFWVHEYGKPQDPEMFDYLYSYSPLHNVHADQKLPFTLLTTADHDDRVSPLHSFKMISELQHTLADNPNPLLLRVTADAGHGASNSLLKVLEDTSIKYCLTANALGLKRQPLPGSLPSAKQ